MKKSLKLTAVLLLCSIFASTACSALKPAQNQPETSQTAVATSETAKPAEASNDSWDQELPSEEKEPVKSNDIVILVTSDVHCCPDKGFGYAGLYRIREKLRNEGCEVLLVDDGDAIEGHGELFGTFDQGYTVIQMMNKMGYDVAIPGNHDFVYGPDRLIQLAQVMKFNYLSANLSRSGTRIFKPYVIKQVNGKKIAFIGITTPRSMGYYNSRSLFKNENGNVIYDFRDGGNGQRLATTVQANVNYCRQQGADYVFLVSHIGQAKKYKSYENISYYIGKTRGIDAVLDGHSHDSYRYEFPNADGKMIPRIGIGSKLSRIGFVRISAETGAIEVGLYFWTNSTPMSEVFCIKNEMSEEVDKAMDYYEKTFYGKIGTNRNKLICTDPQVTDGEGKAVSLANRRETNMGDFCADAFRMCTGSDVAFICADKFSDSLEPGDVSMYDLYRILPARKTVTVEATGKQICDALEWACRHSPSAYWGFLQVSGVSFTVNTKTKSSIKTKKGKFKEVKGQRRVTNVRIGGQPVDPKKTYTVTSYISLIRAQDNGFTMFSDCKAVKTDNRLDFQILSDYVKDYLKGTIGDKYKTSAGRISMI